MDPHRQSSLYAIVQTALFVLFAIAFFADRSPRLFHTLATTIAGSVLAIVGLLIMFAAFIPMRRAVQIAPEPKRGAELVTSGIYRWLRHPMYSGVLLVIVGLLLRKPAPIAIAAALIVVGFLVLKVRFEEKLLLDRYPDYAEYRRGSFGVIPLPRRRSNAR